MSRRVTAGVRVCGVALLAIATWVVVPTSADAQTTVVLDAPDSESIDTVIRGGSLATTNFDRQRLATRAHTSDPWYVRRTLLKFDTETRIPRGASITSARLTLTVAGGRTDTRTLAAYRITKSFDDHIATWRWRKTGYYWSSSGGDLGQRYATASVSGTVGSRVTFDVTSLVQGAVNAQFETSRWTRIAIIDEGSTSDGSYREYYNSESSDASVRPTLTVVYGGSGSTSTPPPPPPSGDSSSGSSLRVLTWNVHHGGIGTDGRYDPGRVAYWIAQMNPHVAMLQEVDTQSQVDAIMSALRSRTGQTWHITFSGLGNLVITRLSPSNRSNCTYNTSGGGGSSSADRVAPHISVVVNGRTINGWSTHLDASSSSVRYAEVGRMKNCATNWSEARIIAGDFNMQSGSSEYSSMVQNYIDGWSTARSAGTTTNYSGNCDGCTRNSRIDYIFGSRGASWLRVASARIYDTSDSDGDRASDHKPLVVTYTVN